MSDHWLDAFQGLTVVMFVLVVTAGAMKSWVWLYAAVVPALAILALVVNEVKKR